MASRELILDGLAWAGISEPARVAKISAKLVREVYGSYSQLTKTRIKEAVRNTSPPYGRGKAICELVGVETERQADIYKQRQTDQKAFQDWLTFRAKMDTRLNYAYAHAFERPPYMPWRSYPGGWEVAHDVRREWEAKESGRDKGDECFAVTHWQEHIVCLVNTEEGQIHIATRLHNGEIVRTFLRENSEDLVQAAITLGGPKVSAAYAQGIRVTTDWVGRTTTVHYINRREVTLPWRAARYEDQENDHGYTNTVQVPVLISGRDMTDEPED